ncbi:PQ loop repeat-domain-containing protein [Chlamydoabsidia padenii]|nr:PQ loop repeat-domain-containing protein [Chlamydoabsidia padenii]
MVDRYLLEQVFSYFGLVLWSFQMAPQVYKNYKRGSTEGVSPWTMLIWIFSGITLGNYNIGLHVAIPLIVQPQLFVLICTMCFCQELYYAHGVSKTLSWCIYFITLAILGGIEVGLTFAYERAEGNYRAIEFFGVLPVVTILFGFLPQYWDIFKYRRVEGVSHGFLFMDFFGSVFSTISLAFRPTIDILSLVNYIGIAIFDAGIFILYYFFQWYNGNKGIEYKPRSEKTMDVEQTADPSSLKS